MSDQEIGKSVVQAVGSNLAYAALSTPQGQAALASTVVLAVAAAPAVAVVAATAGIVYAIERGMNWLNL